MAQSVKGTIDGLFTAMTTLLAAQTGVSGDPVLVSYGMPGDYQPGAIVAIAMDVRQPKTRPTMGTGRSRETAAEIDVVVSVYVGGGDEVQQTATDKCVDLCDLIEAYSRTAGNETLGGACRDSWVSNISGPTPSAAFDPTSGAVMGRIAEATVTYTAFIRY
jgi:hypothetical protein